MAFHAVLVQEETPARVLATVLQEARAELRETQTRLREAERELALLRGVLAQRMGSAARLASGVVLDLEQRTASRDGLTVRFTAGEWRLLAYLLAAGRPVARAEIIAVFYDGACSVSLIATMVCRVRRSLAMVGGDSDLPSRGRYRCCAGYELLLEAP